MLNLQLLDAAANTANQASNNNQGSIWSVIIMYVVLIGGLYLLMFRPQSKRRKQEAEMRNNVEIGDEITTIGGIVGKVVSIKNDESETLVIETSFDHSKILIKRWAISSIDNDKTAVKAEKTDSKTEETEKKGFFSKLFSKKDENK